MVTSGLWVEPTVVLDALKCALIMPGEQSAITDLVQMKHALSAVNWAYLLQVCNNNYCACATAGLAKEGKGSANKGKGSAKPECIFFIDVSTFHL